MSNIHISSHPCVLAKLSQLRSVQTSARETRALIHEIATLLAAETLGQFLKVEKDGQDTTPLNLPYEVTKVSTKIVLVPVLRSGLGMVDAFNAMLPHPAPIHHLGLFREKITLQPVEYYNNLPTNSNTFSSSSSSSSTPADIAFILDPIIATGGTAEAAIQTLKEWGVKKIVFVSVLGTRDGVERAANEWREGVEVFVGGMDEETNEKGMIVPGVGDIGDRLFLTIGK